MNPTGIIAVSFVSVSVVWCGVYRLCCVRCRKIRREINKREVLLGQRGGAAEEVFNLSKLQIEQFAKELDHADGANNAAGRELLLSAELTKEQRQRLHAYTARFGSLESSSRGPGTARRMVVRKKRRICTSDISDGEQGQLAIHVNVPPHASGPSIV